MTSDYSPAAFSFAISFRDDGAEAIDGAFQEVSGLDNERQVHDLEEGGENRFVHAFPGSIKHSNLVLKLRSIGHHVPFVCMVQADI